MAKVRSPNYPQISLPRAIELTKKVYDANHLHKADPLAVVQAMGYNGLHGTSKGAISALKKYNLLVEEGDGQFRVSRNALAILVDPPESPERRKMIVEAAFAPTLFSELHTEYGKSVPNDVILRSFLLKRGFSPNTVDAPIAAYRETMAYVAHMTEAAEPTESSDSTSEVERDLASLSVEPLEAQRAPQPTPKRPDNVNLFTGPVPPTNPNEVEWLRGNLGRNTTYRILVAGEVGEREISRLIKLLEAQKVVYEDDVPPQP